MPTTQERLDNYLAAEARILAGGQSLRFAERQLQQAELETIRKSIVELKRELAAEQGVAAGSAGSLRHKTVIFNPCG
jgi:hypothetical protein